ncbi:hypothetical protein C1646_763519 [Rhizophagus diaphanus]|nr:hypothetical protein C1646_763519 [Rhizophagus diaphanus] [Rhizophagus sp. MUCL 43196]
MSSRNTKKRANEKININNANKRPCNKQETVIPPSDNLNDLLNHTTSQNKGTGTKRSYKKKQEETVAPLNGHKDNNDNTQSKCKRGCKKKQEAVAPPSSQIITELLKNDDVSNDNYVLNGNNVLNDNFLNDDVPNDDVPDDDVPNDDVPDDDVPINDHILNDDDILNDEPSTIAVPFRLVTTQKTGSNSQNMSMFDSKANVQIQNDFIPLNRTAPSRPILISDSRKNSPIDYYRPTLTAKESKNEFNFLNRTSRTISALESKFATSNEAMPSSRSTRTTPLRSKDRAEMSLSSYLESSVEELIRKVINYELNSAEGIEWLHIANRHFGDFRNKLVNGVEDLIKNFKEKRLSLSATAHVLSQWLNATNIDELWAQNSMHYLCNFIQHAFTINYSSRDTEKTKSLDRLTKDIAVSS